MHIWRVAHMEHTYCGFPSGPYYSDGLPFEVRKLLRDMGDAHSYHPTHPAPSQDLTLGLIFNDERCGFDSREALYEWFAGYINLLHDCGFRVYEYEVPAKSVRVGKFGQVVFLAEDARGFGFTELELEPVCA